MEAIQRLPHRLLAASLAPKPLSFPLLPCALHSNRRRLCFPPTHLVAPHPSHAFRRADYRVVAAATWFSGFGGKKAVLPEIVKAGDPVLHEPAQEVPVDQVGSERIQSIIDDMVAVMRNAPGVGLAAPQIGIPLKIIVLEDTKKYISYAPKEEIEAQDRRPFDLLVILNPKVKKKGNKTALFFEGCLRTKICERIVSVKTFGIHETVYLIQHPLPSVDGYRAVVERHLEVEVTGLDRDGCPIRIDASGWQARILQHECDHLDGMIYVDKMVPRTFRIVENLDLPLPTGCLKLGVH